MELGRVVSIGTFDGVHAGHAAILREMTTQSRSQRIPRQLYTFNSPPRWTKETPPERHLILPQDLRLRLLRQHAEAVQSVSIDTVRGLHPRQFAASVLVEQLHARVVVEGESFRFGVGRSGDTATLRRLGHAMGFEVIIVPSVQIAGDAVSSTRIRQAIRAGDLRLARLCLGRPPLLVGSVVRGDGIGRSLGIPTANLSVDPHVLLPPHGIYLVHAWDDSVCSGGLLYIGVRPTLKTTDVRCEVHLLDSPAHALYGRMLEIHLLEKLRDDQAFSSLGALQRQIETDVAAARQRLPQHPSPSTRILG
jgi:riboflavin kinase / FMN adenylyltransferase